MLISVKSHGFHKFRLKGGIAETISPDVDLYARINQSEMTQYKSIIASELYTVGKVRLIKWIVLYGLKLNLWAIEYYYLVLLV